MLAGGVLATGGSARALMVAAESALLCPELGDFAAVSAGAPVPAACVRVARHDDLYGPVGRAGEAPGGPFVRVRHGEAFYWAEESAFYARTGTPLGPGALPPPAD